MYISVSNVALENVRHVRTYWDAVVRVVGHVRIGEDKAVLFEEPGFCVVEFGMALARWVGQRERFDYVSVESDAEPLIRFEQVTAEDWEVAVAFPKDLSSLRVAYQELEVASMGYIDRLFWLLPNRQEVLSVLAEAREAEHLLKRWGTMSRGTWP